MIIFKSKRKTTHVDLDTYVNDGSGVKTSTKMKMMLMKKSGSSSGKKKKSSLKIFRRKSTSTKVDYDAPPIQPGLTWTNSEDEASSDADSAFTSGSTHEIQGNSTLLLVPSSSFDNDNNKSHDGDAATKQLEFLMEKHQTEIEEKQIEIELMQDQIVVLNEKNMEKNLAIELMKEQHGLEIHEKDMDLKSMENRMIIMMSQHDEEIEILETIIQEKENEMIDLQARYHCTKADLFEVSSTLIQTQHKLHDLSNSWPYKFFL